MSLKLASPRLWDALFEKSQYFFRGVVDFYKTVIFAGDQVTKPMLRNTIYERECRSCIKKNKTIHALNLCKVVCYIAKSASYSCGNASLKGTLEQERDLEQRNAILLSKKTSWKNMKTVKKPLENKTKREFQMLIFLGWQKNMKSAMSLKYLFL